MGLEESSKKRFSIWKIYFMARDSRSSICLVYPREGYEPM